MALELKRLIAQKLINSDIKKTKKQKTQSRQTAGNLKSHGHVCNIRIYKDKWMVYNKQKF